MFPNSHKRPGNLTRKGQVGMKGVPKKMPKISLLLLKCELVRCISGKFPAVPKQTLRQEFMPTIRNVEANKCFI